ncbi:MAG: tetratricopeptide repeat protein [Eubacteriales bacterium]
MENKPKPRGWNKKALNDLALAANGVPESQYDVGMRLFYGKGVPKNKKLGLDWLIKSALQNNEDAEYMLYTMYSAGTIVTQNTTVAFGFLKKSAEGTNKYAQYELAEHYMGQSDYDEAIEWLKKSARQEHAPAQYELGSCYYYGRGTIRAEEIGLEWIGKAALKNYQPAKNLLKKIKEID